MNKNKETKRSYNSASQLISIPFIFLGSLSLAIASTSGNITGLHCGTILGVMLYSIGFVLVWVKDEDLDKCLDGLDDESK